MAVNPFCSLVQDRNQCLQTRTIEKVFGFTFNPKQKGFIYLKDLANTLKTDIISKENLENALFERILMPYPQDFSQNADNEICETRTIIYLSNCFKKNRALEQNDFTIYIEGIIMTNIVTAIKQPELHVNQNLFDQLYQVMKIDNFLRRLYEQFCLDDDGHSGAIELFTFILNKLHTEIRMSTLASFSTQFFSILKVYATFKDLAKLFMDYCQPQDENIGIKYGDTLLGAMFNVSVLPKPAEPNFSYFQEPLDQASNILIQNALWLSTYSLGQEIYNLLLNLMKCSLEVRGMTLRWLSNCLKTNAVRGQLSHNFNEPNHATTVSDGFMINLVNVLAKLCRPFCATPCDEKVLKVDPTYCAVSNEKRLAMSIHLDGLDKETCLVPTDDGEERLISDAYTFVTECFYLGHRAFDLGFRVAYEKLVRIHQDMSRIERAYHDTVNQTGFMSEVADTIKERMSTELKKYMSIKCAMCEPNFHDSLFNLISNTAYWLSQVAVAINQKPPYAPLYHRDFNFPLPDEVPNTLKCIPEFIVENIVTYLIFAKRFNPKLFEEHGFENLKPILSFLLVYMSSPKYTKNPHLRARLAEGLEALLPLRKDDSTTMSSFDTQRERLFKEHVHREQIVEILLDVFVGIEVTGQNVQFEQKFNYRRPMYTIMEYLWDIPEYQNRFIALAQNAESSMEAVSPPIFLRFINLLINDAIFLLDESLTNMSKIREIEAARDAGEWNRLSFEDRAQNISHFQHIGLMARFDNILGRDTTRTLNYLTSKIIIVFTHKTMVDRVAAMLNYFLLNLVGPNQKNYKVKDYNEYSFDPAATVLDICEIYINLKNSDHFCLAISQDGRAYSPQLFVQAEDVLAKIGGGHLISELQEIANKVAQIAVEYENNEVVLQEAPDHFLDPIMSTLMLDPVILPSSRQTVDRATIARHLLSDQTDPFNREPLSMDQVISNTELAHEIKVWMDEKKMKRKYKCTQQQHL